MANAKRPDDGVRERAKKNLANLKKGKPLGAVGDRGATVVPEDADTTYGPDTFAYRKGDKKKSKGDQ